MVARFFVRSRSFIALLTLAASGAGCSDEKLVGSGSDRLRAQPPALSGGTLLVLRDGRTAIVSDPEQDRILIADLEALRSTFEIQLSAYDEPGRAAEDAEGRAHVVLRGSGELVTLDPAQGEIVGRRPVCAEPRGITFWSNGNQLVVACAGGELVFLPTEPAPALRTLRLDRDLRDVVVVGDRLIISRFRSAEVLFVDPDSGTIARRVSVPGFFCAATRIAEAATLDAEVAWRLFAGPGWVGLLHQRALDTRPSPLARVPIYYGPSEPCFGLVSSWVTRISPLGEILDSTPLTGDLMLDAATDAGGRQIMAVSNGGAVVAIDLVALGRPRSLGAIAERAFLESAITVRPIVRTVVAVAALPSGKFVAQVRDPGALIVEDQMEHLEIPGATPVSRGQQVFHTPTPGGLSCASCHPEGGDDGRVWHFEGLGPRRTQSLRGGILSTAPFHWDGEHRDLSSLMHEVFERRMLGTLEDDDVRQVEIFLHSLPALRASTAQDPVAAERGRDLFDSPITGCSDCHAGEMFTNNRTVSMGGHRLQVPALVGVSLRAPYFHDGCAKTLEQRFFGSCDGSGPDHGGAAGLTGPEVFDLIAFLETL